MCCFSRPTLNLCKRTCMSSYTQHVHLNRDHGKPVFSLPFAMPIRSFASDVCHHSPSSDSRLCSSSQSICLISTVDRRVGIAYDKPTDSKCYEFGLCIDWIIHIMSNCGGWHGFLSDKLRMLWTPICSEKHGRRKVFVICVTGRIK